MGLLDNVVREVARSTRVASRALRPATRDAWMSYRAAFDARDVHHRADATARRSFVLAELRQQVRYAALLPFWRERFERAGIAHDGEFSFADFARLPVLERGDIAAAGDALLHPAVPPALRRKMATGGSSGTPTVTWTGPVERGWGESAIEQFERLVGVTPSSRRALLWGHNLDPVTRESMRDRVEDWLENREWFDCFRLSDDRLRAYHARLQDFRPDVMVAYASALATLAEALDGTGQPAPRYPRIGFITGAEKLYPAQRELIERVFRRPVFERYGGRDLGMLASQTTPGDTRYRVDTANVFLEIEDGSAEGSLLVSKLHADAMPLFRYRSGDIARVSRDEAGLLVTTIDEVLGRELARVWLPDGRWMHGTVVPHLLKDFAISDYQLVQAEDYSTTLHVVTREGYDAATERDILAALRHSLPDIPLTIAPVPSIERGAAGKWMPVVSRATDPRKREAAR